MRQKKELLEWARHERNVTEGKELPSNMVNINKAIEWIHLDVERERSWWRFAAPVAIFFGFVFGLTIGVNCCAEHQPRSSSSSSARQRRLQHEGYVPKLD